MNLIIYSKIKKSDTTFEVQIYESNPLTFIYETASNKEGYRISDIKKIMIL